MNMGQYYKGMITKIIGIKPVTFKKGSYYVITG
jgi:hypothetical protein